MLLQAAVGEPEGRAVRSPHGSLSLGPGVGEIILLCLDNQGEGESHRERERERERLRAQSCKTYWRFEAFLTCVCARGC